MMMEDAMRVGVIGLILLAVLSLFAETGARAGEKKPYLFADENAAKPADADDVILPLGEDYEIGSYQDTGLRPANLETYMYDTLIWYTVQWGGRLWWVRDKNIKIFDASFSTFWHNLTSSPEWDDGDTFLVNWVMHPFFGMLHYQFYRARGHSMWASALGSVIQSTLFEYAIEGWVIKPSGTDLIVTPAIGIPLGWSMEKLSEWLIEQDSGVARVAAYVANPTRIFARNRNLGLINPLTGAFQFQGPFTISTTKGKALELAYPRYFEPVLPLGRVGIDFEVVTLKDAMGNGQLIVYPARLEFPSESGFWGIYLDIPYGGVNSVEIGDTKIRDGFEFGNLGIGAKGVLAKSSNFALSAGTKIFFPTSFTDDQNRLQQVIKYRRYIPTYLYEAYGVSPYITAGAWRGPLSIQTSIGFDFIFGAGNFEGNDFENRFTYHAAAGLDIPAPGSPTVYLEFDGYTFTTYDSEGSGTDLYVTPGLRFGRKYSPGFAVQFPVSGPSKDVAKADFIFDFQLRF